MRSFRRAVAGMLVLSTLVCSGCFLKSKTKKENGYSYDDIEAVMGEYSTFKTETLKDYEDEDRHDADFKYVICSGREAQEVYKKGINLSNRFPTLKVSKVFLCMPYKSSLFFMITPEEQDKGNMYFKKFCNNSKDVGDYKTTEVEKKGEYQYLISESDAYYTAVYQRGDTILYMRVHKKSDNVVEIADAVCKQLGITSLTEWIQEN